MTRLPELKRIADLSECEREILALIGNGLRMVQIADRMRRSVKTIEYHRSKIGKKLGVANRVELARVAIQTGLSPVTPAHERDNVRLQQALRVEIARRERSQLALQEIDAGTAAMTGKAFFRSLVRHLALALGCRYACVCDFIEDGKNRGHPIAFWRDDRFVENCDCPRASGICEHLVRQELSYCAAGAQELLRDQEQFVDLDVDSYLAAYLRDSRGRPIGMLSVLHDAPIEREAQPELIVRIFAARAGAELERRHTERALHDSEAAIHAILETAVDAIVTIDDAGIIQAANASTSRMFGYSAEELAGQNLKVLMPDPFRSAHDDYLTRYLTTGDTKIIGIGREVIGRRKDGTTFPVDLAVREMRVKNRCLFTGILRDMSDRRHAVQEARRQPHSGQPREKSPRTS